MGQQKMGQQRVAQVNQTVSSGAQRGPWVRQLTHSEAHALTRTREEGAGRAWG